MSFQEQERALFDLLLEKPLRDAFCKNGPDALVDYTLTREERAHFYSVRRDALQMDAAMRINLILAAFCRHFPLSYSIFSSLQDGLGRLEKPINSALMQNPPAHRPALYGRHLAALLKTGDFADQRHFDAATAIVEAEATVAFVSAARKETISDNQEQTLPSLPAHWQSLPLRMSEHVAGTELPRPYQTLLTALCPTVGSGLWRHLKNTPLPAVMRDTVLAVEEPRFMLVKAVVRQYSSCDPVIDHKTVELSAGFAPVFRHINGSASADDLLALLQKAGANEALLLSVREQLLQLLQEGMLETGTSSK